jgi:hypothetical protein
VRYPSSKLEDAVREFERAATAAARDAERISATTATSTHAASSSVEAEWQRIAEQLSLAAECFRLCSASRLPAHRCDAKERVFVAEGCLGLVLAVANTLELIDRANAEAIVVAADAVEAQAHALRRAPPGDFAEIVSAARELSSAIQRVVFAVEARIQASGDDSGAPELRVPIDTLSKALPLLISSTRVGILHPEQDGVRLSAECVILLRACQSVLSPTRTLLRAQCRGNAYST